MKIILLILSVFVVGCQTQPGEVVATQKKVGIYTETVTMGKVSDSSREATLKALDNMAKKTP